MTYTKRKLYKFVKDFSSTRKTVKKVHLAEHHQIELSTTDKLSEDIEEAQKLHASVYLRRGFVDETEVKDGKLTKVSDPHQQHALYFIVKKPTESRSKVVATARQIFYDPPKGFSSFPLIDNANINPEMLKEILKHDPSKCVEISGLAKRRETDSATILLLYRKMWQHSLKEHHTLWLMACDQRVFNKLRILFGTSIKKIGKQTPYKGANVIPCVVYPQETLSEFIRISRRKALLLGLRRKDLIRFFVDGLSRDVIPVKDMKVLDSIIGKNE